MSKIKLLLDVIEDMRRLADSLETIAGSIEGTAATAQAEETRTKEEASQPAITIDQVRAVLAEKSGEGKTAEVKALLFKYDAGKLSGVKPEDYPALLEEAKRL